MKLLLLKHLFRSSNACMSARANVWLCGNAYIYYCLRGRMVSIRCSVCVICFVKIQKNNKMVTGILCLSSMSFIRSVGV